MMCEAQWFLPSSYSSGLMPFLHYGSDWWMAIRKRQRIANSEW
ncbi:hypothetical protein [Fervidibacter sacchari]